MPEESVEATIARYDERIKAASEKAEKAAQDAAVCRIRLDSLGWEREEINRLARIIEFFDEGQLRKLARMVETYEDQTADKREFDRSLRISVITMIVSVLLFSVLVPLLQHYIVH